MKLFVDGLIKTFEIVHCISNNFLPLLKIIMDVSKLTPEKVDLITVKMLCQIAGTQQIIMQMLCKIIASGSQSSEDKIVELYTKLSQDASLIYEKNVV